MNSIEEQIAKNVRPRLLPPRAWLLSLLAQLPAALWAWPLNPSRIPVFVGGALILAGSAMVLWAERLFRRSGVGVCPFSPVPSLISGGPYRFSRNPMYLGMVLFSGGVPLLMGLAWNIWPAAALAVWLHFRFVLPEEDFLRKTLGLDYLEFASRHSRWLGLPGSRNTPVPGLTRAPR